MNHNQLFVFAAIVFVILVFFLFRRPAGDYQQISQEEAKRIMEEEPEALILDVRTEAEYEEGHIPGAICIPNETLRGKEPEQLPDKEQVILVYCRSGNRSKQAAGRLAQMGYRKVKDFGGILTWPYEIERG